MPLEFPAPTTDKDPSKRALAFSMSFTNQNLEMLTNLWSRWQDEKDYEDINDYAEPFKPICEEYGIELVRMNAAPFGFFFKADGRTYQLRVNARTGDVSYKRINHEI